MAKKQSQPTIIDAEVVSESPSQALAIRSPQDALAMSRKPEKVLEEAKAAATALMQVVESKPKKIQFNGQTYLTFEDWQTLARFYGYTVREDGDPEPVSMGDVQGFKASAVVLDRDGIIRSRATSYCMNDEDKWSNRPKYAYVYLCRSGGVSVEDPGKDEIIWEDNPKVQGKKRPKKERKLIGEEKVPMFQLASMAQTRACAKALRNTLAWVAVLAGYAATPAEEMNTSSEPPSEDFNQDDRPSEHSESAQAKVKKFAGTVIDAQRIDAGDHQVLVLKLRYGAKRKGKDGKWTTVTEETIVVAEQSNFMRLLERSRDTKIEVECSQQSGGKGKMYWRVEKLLSGGTEPPAGETKADSVETKAAQAETKPAEGKTMPRATDICECGHAAGNHAYGADACTIADCKCQSFRVKTTQTRNSGPETKTASSNPSAQSSDQPASSPAQPATVPATPVIVGQPPVVAKVQRNLVMAGGKKKAVEWLQVRGKVRGFGWSKDKHGVYQLLQAPTVATTSKRSEYIAVVLEGLPLWPDNQKGGHDLFLCWHKSLFECIKTLKVGDTFIFCYEQETVADGRVYQQIEDTEFVNGTEYLNGKPALPAAGEVAK